MIAKAEEDGSDDLTNLDLSGVAFPSDGLSIAVLRRVHPDLFDRGHLDEQPLFFLNPHGEKAGRIVDGVGSMLFCERELAAWAYANARGIEGPPHCDPADTKKELAGHYIRYGIATGAHHAAALMQGIESQGANLAKQKPR